MTTCQRCGSLKYDNNSPCKCNLTPDYILRLENKLDEILKILKEREVKP